MHWLFAIIGGIVGAGCGAAGTAFLGMIIGAMLGWHFGRHVRLHERLAALEKKLAVIERAREAQAEAPAPIAPRAAAPATPEAVERTAAPAPAVPAPPSEPSAGPPDVARTDEFPSPVGVSAAATEAAPAPQAPKPRPAPAVSGSPAVYTAREPSTPPPPVLPPSGSPVWPTREPEPPSGGERLGAFLRGWFTEGNVPVKVGVTVLFFGLAALMKYAVDQGFLSFPIEWRLAGIAALAVAGLVFGARQLGERRVFGLALEGGSLGVLLLTVFASYRLYHLLPSGAAFTLIVLIVAGAALLAVLQDAMALAVLGFVGGYLAPVLIRTGSADHVALFSYYAVLNVAVFAVAWIRPWRALNLVGFAFTFAVWFFWGKQYYRPELFASVEPFLVLFFLLYVGIAVAYALRDPQGKRGFVDGTLVFGTPLVAFPLQVALVEPGERMFLAYSAMAVGALYAGLTALLIRRPGLRLLGESFAALSVGFLTLAVPLALSARWTSGAWALEGAALIWLGLRQERRLPIVAGALLQFAAAISYLAAMLPVGTSNPQPGDLIVLNGWCFGALILAFSALDSSRRLDKAGVASGFGALAFLWGWGWWIFAGVNEIDAFAPRADTASWLVAFTALTMVLAAIALRLSDWSRLGWPVMLGYALMPPLAIASAAQNHGVLEDRSGLAWLAWFAAGAFALRTLVARESGGLAFAHLLWLAGLVLLPAMELEHLASAHWSLGEGWSAALVIAPLIVLVLLTWRAPALGTWPVGEERFAAHAGRWYGLSLCAGLLWGALSLGNDGSTAPIAYVPLLNPLELTQLAVLLLIGAWLRERCTPAQRQGAWPPLLAAAFVALSFGTLRGVHHLAALPWSPSLLDSMVAQASLTVVWSLVGMGAWIIGSKRRSRGTWLAGAVLMAIVLAKLALIDRRYTGDLPGIVSFLAFGVLCLIVGYIAPSPPKQTDAGEPK